MESLETTHLIEELEDDCKDSVKHKDSIHTTTDLLAYLVVGNFIFLVIQFLATITSQSLALGVDTADM